jgi:CrcB protein
MSPLIWYVAAGSAAGGVARFLLSTAIAPRTPGSFPAGTFIVNVIGSIGIGFVARYAFGTSGVSPEMRVLLTTGFLGGFTTFSAFSYDTVALIESGAHGTAAIYVVASVVVSLVGTVAGIALGAAVIAGRGHGA